MNHFLNLWFWSYNNISNKKLRSHQVKVHMTHASFVRFFFRNWPNIPGPVPSKVTQEIVLCCSQHTIFKRTSQRGTKLIESKTLADMSEMHYLITHAVHIYCTHELRNMFFSAASEKMFRRDIVMLLLVSVLGGNWPPSPLYVSCTKKLIFACGQAGCRSTFPLRASSLVNDVQQISTFRDVPSFTMYYEDELCVISWWSNSCLMTQVTGKQCRATCLCCLMEFMERSDKNVPCLSA